MATTVKAFNGGVVTVVGLEWRTEDELLASVLEDETLEGVLALAPSGYYPGAETRLAAGVAALLGGKVTGGDEAPDEGAGEEAVY
jgi:hypothetical protein